MGISSIVSTRASRRWSRAFSRSSSLIRGASAFAFKGRGRPVQKHKRTQDWRAGPFRSSLPRGEPQIWGVSEAMSARRVLRTRRENNVQQRDATLPGGDLDPGPGPHLDQNVLAGYATVALASILDSSGGLFSDAARPGQCPFSYWAQTWHSKIAIRDESQK